MEALARLRLGHRDNSIAALLEADETSLRLREGGEQIIEQRGGRSRDTWVGAGVAAALQTRLADLFVEFVGAVRRQTPEENLCLAGSLFYHSSINTAVKRSGLFPNVFVPVDPGNPGLAVGTALHENRTAPRPLSPFLGPAYSSQEVKETLENCKLPCSWESEESGIGIAVQALLRGHLVAWFDGAMEWGPRSLGARCILANPFAPFVLENLNRFLKRREHWRGYALSGLEEAVSTQFDGPAHAPFMECDYRPRDLKRFAHAMPGPDAAVRIQTVGAQAPDRFRRLLAGVRCRLRPAVSRQHIFQWLSRAHRVQPARCGPRVLRIRSGHARPERIRADQVASGSSLMSDQYILGISAFYHDSAACLLKNGEIIAAGQEERFTRKKGDRHVSGPGCRVLPEPRGHRCF